MPGDFARSTSVSPEKTRAEIELVLRKYGASSFASGWDAQRAFVGFVVAGRTIRFTLTLPAANVRDVTHTPKGKVRTKAQQEAEYDQLCRTYWRRLLLCIRAKLESVESGIETFEEAFLAHIVLPDSTTVGQWAKAAIAEAIATRQMPRSLLALPPGDA